ncbi:MAG: HDOD domain-containing protein [Geobacteraceae bacterium]|nr:HDOD domain-containing protein [Geobacteraceae bacterium]
MSVHIRIRYALCTQPIELPVFNPVALDLLQMLAEPYTDIFDVVRTINEDQALAAQVLRMANSPSYMGRNKCETIKSAAIRLGARQITNLAMAASHASLHASENPVVNDIMQDLWLHSHACALGCKSVALNTGQQNLADQAYLAGLLHDIGKLYLLKALERIIHNRELEIVLEKELLRNIFAEMHVEFGCRLMDHWNLPGIYRAIVAHHHDKTFNPDDILLAIVRMVNFNSRNFHLNSYPTQNEAQETVPDASPLYVDEAAWTKMESVMTGSLSIVH